ncbi:hypothetical protein CEXT_248151 [Caerostris extrusa]|uniref:Uncharacterized protein n=1 Tax=Caerostris extrusa TaxID=172846 RepID=A0AAV4XVC9_CAEEX|nr:hypothetical protein CEXT_248151 [Caerostris extrusa]
MIPIAASFRLGSVPGETRRGRVTEAATQGRVDDASEPESDTCPFRDSSCHSPTSVSDAGPIYLVIWKALKELCNLDFYIRCLPETKILANIIIMHLLDIQR